MTNAATSKQEVSQADKSERKPRGTYPPMLRLSDAVDLAKKINEQAAGSATYDLFSQITGNTKTSSSFLKKVAALRLYGIVEDTENIVTLSDIGRRISHPVNEIDDALGIKDAMLRIDTLAKIYERHRGRLLPEDQFLTNILVQELKLDKEVAPQWVEWFKDAAKAARLFHLRADSKTQVLDEPAGSSAWTDDKGRESKGAGQIPPPLPPPPPNTPPPLTEEYVIPISLGRGRLARVELPQDWQAAKDLERFLKMLRLALDEDIGQADP